MSDSSAADRLDAQADRLVAMAAELRAEATRLRHDQSVPPSAATMLSLEQACTVSGLSMFSVRQMLADGRLAEVTVGRRRFVTRASLDALTQAAS